MNKLRTPEDAKAWLNYQGISVPEFCRQNNLPSVSLVYEIINGRKRCLRGTSHNIAVLLGMKHGVLTTHPGRMARALHSNNSAHMGAAA
jgi:gp16 family phage-associated protein